MFCISFCALQAFSAASPLLRARSAPRMRGSPEAGDSVSQRQASGEPFPSDRWQRCSRNRNPESRLPPARKGHPPPSFSIEGGVPVQSRHPEHSLMQTDNTSGPTRAAESTRLGRCPRSAASDWTLKCSRATLG